MPQTSTPLRDAFHKVRGQQWRYKTELEDLVLQAEGFSLNSEMPYELEKDVAMLMKLRDDILRAPCSIYTLDIDEPSRLSLKQSLHIFLDDPRGRYGKIYRRAYISIMMIGLLPMMIETTPGLEDGYKTMQVVDMLATCMFVVDFMVRGYASPSLRRFWKNPSSLVELVIIMILFIELGIPTFGTTLLHDICCVGRLVLAVRKLQIVQLLIKSFVKSLHPLFVILYLLLLIVWLFGTLLYFFNLGPTDIFEGGYVALYTLYGVGYGVPLSIASVASKILLVILMILGPSVMAVPIRLMGAYLTAIWGHKGVIRLIGECQKVFQLFGFPPDNFRLIFRSMDKKANGYVTYEEFLCFANSVGIFGPIDKKPHSVVAHAKADVELIHIFHELSNRSTGIITMNSFVAGVARSGYVSKRHALQSLQREFHLEKTCMHPIEEQEQLETQIRKMVTRVDFARHNQSTLHRMGGRSISSLPRNFFFLPRN